MNKISVRDGTQPGHQILLFISNSNQFNKDAKQIPVNGIGMLYSWWYEVPVKILQDNDIPISDGTEFEIFNDDLFNLISKIENHDFKIKLDKCLTIKD